jgi:hypothetical protein
MKQHCLYCKGYCEDGAVKCKNCGAPISFEEEAAIDLRSCPFCKRKLLALASPSCSFCARRLPELFIKNRTEHLRRISEITGASNRRETKEKIDEVLKIAGKQDKSTSSLLELVNWLELTDLFS